MQPTDRPDRPYEDPIVADVRGARARLLADAGGDLDALFAQMCARQGTRRQALVQPPPREAHATEAA